MRTSLTCAGGALSSAMSKSVRSSATAACLPLRNHSSAIAPAAARVRVSSVSATAAFLPTPPSSRSSATSAASAPGSLAMASWLSELPARLHSACAA